MSEDEKNKLSEGDFIRFIGLCCASSVYNCAIGCLFKKEKNEQNDSFEMLVPIPNIRKMTDGRCNRQKLYLVKNIVPYMFSDDTLIDSDPWWMIREGIREYNRTQYEQVAASKRKVLDESMSAWVPRTSKTGGLPHLSFVERKPEPLGTEFKVVSDFATGVLLHLEVMEGGAAMKEKKYVSENYGSIAATTSRIYEGTRLSGQQQVISNTNDKSEKSDIYYGDAWFGSVATAVSVSKKRISFCWAN